MNIYLLLGVVIAWLMYIPMSKAILASKNEQNLATFILWGLLDLEAAVSLFVQGGNWYLPGAYVLGCIVTILCILKAGTFKWGWFEWLCMAFVVFCAILWVGTGPYMAAVISTNGVIIAGLPQIKDAYRMPDKMPLGPYIGFCVANALSTYGAGSRFVEDRLYAGACTMLCIAIVAVIVSGLYVRPYLRYRRQQFI